LCVLLAIASLRHEGCFFSAAGLPKLASEQAGGGEETKGTALASQQEVLFGFCQERMCIPLVLTYEHQSYLPCAIG
jgi:hypothetical protein